ncbi:unnamed protein product [Somion occarium]|uniref:RING-type domain-containing protein n=1 Tax=Somion occarium TaxID=3059160 RepID=A0ABP1CQ59_9APHY
MDLDVIEIPSSPEPRPSCIKASVRKQRRSRRPIPQGDIIEITDSEDEFAIRVTRSRTRSRKPTPLRSQPRAGPSKPQPVKEKPYPLFLPDPEESFPGPSNRMSSPQPAPLAHNEDHDPLFMPLPPSQSGSLLEPIPETSAVPQEDGPYDRYVAQVLEIIPDVDPAHVVELIIRHHANYKEKVVEPVLHALFEDSTYPKKVDKGKGKRKRERSDDGGDERLSVKQRQSNKEEVDYLKKDFNRIAGQHYIEAALQQLMTDFPRMPKSHVRKRLYEEEGFYSLAYFVLEKDQSVTPLPYRPNSAARLHAHKKSKGKEVQRTDPEFEKERQWFLRKLRERNAEKESAVATQLSEKEQEDAEPGIECGCCFTDYPFDHMVQCPDAHLFCKTCMCTYAETLLGSHDPNIICMDQSGCKLPFPESELRRFLSPKLLSLYERVKQRKEIEAAGLEGLEECPFCEYKVVIENEQERLFHCQNEDCGAVSCRSCKKLDHLPRTCKEVEEDKKLDAQHTIEEAMTRALMRNCPKCKKAFVKEMGCNKMTCPNCRTLSCYICRQVITSYEHFNQPPPYNVPADKTKCPLWDSVEQRHSDEVAEAARKALEQYKREHPDVDEKDIRIDIPKAPAPASAPAIPGHPNVHIRAPPVPLPAHLPPFPPLAAPVRMPGPVPQVPMALPQFHPFAPAGINPQGFPQMHFQQGIRQHPVPPPPQHVNVAPPRQRPVVGNVMNLNPAVRMNGPVPANFQAHFMAGPPDLQATRAAQNMAAANVLAHARANRAQLHRAVAPVPPVAAPVRARRAARPGTSLRDLL